AALIGLAAGLVATRGSPAAVPVEADGPVTVARPALSLGSWSGLFALSGFCALSLEIVWFRIIDVAVKSTAFTFGTVLAVYLLGLAAGTLAGVVMLGRLRGGLLAVFLACECALLACAGLAVL